MNQGKKAFTLVELLVAMAIIAILIGMSVFGISTAQRVLRDDQRRKGVEAIVSVIQARYGASGGYPRTGRLTLTSAGEVKINGQVASAGNTIGGPATPRSSSSASGTLYCYRLAADGYIIGAQLEDGTWFLDLSTSNGGGCAGSPIPITAN